MDFINKIFLKRIDETVHEQFVRFGKGIYQNRAVIKLQKSASIKISSSFEYSKDLALLVCELTAKLSVKGSLISRVPLPELGSVKVKKGVYDYDVDREMTNTELKKFLEMAKYALLNIQSAGVELKCKEKLPKPGKAEGKIDDKFCQLVADVKHWNVIRKEFFPDVPEAAKKVIISHVFDVRSIMTPSGVTDYEQMRLMAKRVGKLTRILDIDKQESKREVDFEA